MIHGGGLLHAGNGRAACGGNIFAVVVAILLPVSTDGEIYLSRKRLGLAKPEAFRSFSLPYDTSFHLFMQFTRSIIFVYTHVKGFNQRLEGGKK